ncbi:hypothetical protein [Gordonia polyisoprenivorans]|uniref:hypothetical protein n=1 Tax=Gordonia polyisoprenivorans TaxID=84595 RepID=UPI0003611B9F|nr:hypothetical protein [Gordonia polyisoprenivorans]
MNTTRPVSEVIGRRLRRTVVVDGTYRTDEGRVAMVVPSRGGTCWMVTRQDDSVDVWPVKDPTAAYHVVDDAY